MKGGNKRVSKDVLFDGMLERWTIMEIVREASYGTCGSAGYFYGMVSQLGMSGFASCSTICQPYSVPGGGTPCGSKCMLYCVGK